MTRKENAITPNWIDPDDAPPWAAEDFKTAQISRGAEVIREATGTLRRGRPKSDAPKQAVSLRLDPDVLERLRATGPGWQSRVNDILRKAVAA